MYPGVAKTICEPFPIPRNWKRFIAFDYGLSDPSVFVYGAVDEQHGILYIYKELRVNDKNVEELAKIYKQGAEDIPSGGLVTAPIIDPKSGPKRDYEKKSLADHFLDYGIAFKPGFINVDARVFRLNTYIESGKLRIFNTCVDLIRELREYKFKADESQHSGFAGKPEDKNNHGINALEWITMECPADPSNLVYGIYDRLGRDLTKERAEQDPGYWALRDDDDDIQNLETAFDTPDYTYGFF